MRRILLLVGGGFTIAGALLPGVELQVSGLPVSILSSVAAAGAAAFGTYRILHSADYEVAPATGIVHWSAGLGLWAMGLGAASALAALLTARDD